MKKFSITISCLLVMAGLSFGQTQSINLFAHGTTNTSITLTPGSTFSLDTSVTFTGFSAVGLSYWLEAQDNGLAANLTLNSETYLQNWDATASGTNNGFGGTTGIDAGYKREGRDLGSTSTFTTDDNGVFVAWNDARNAGTYQVSQLNFTLGGAIAPGTYLLAVTHLTPVISEINDTNFAAHNVAQSFFTITIIPEPATWSLIGLGGLASFGLTWLRARRS